MEKNPAPGYFPRMMKPLNDFPASGWMWRFALPALLVAAGCAKNQATNEPPKLTKDQIRAWQQAAEKGDALVKYSLARLYRDGEGIPKDLTNAAVWFQKSAAAGYAKAQYHLGLAFQEGAGVPKDEEEAAKWFEKAAEQGNANAQELLGFMYWKGTGVTTNCVAAHKWLTLAAANGEGKAAKGVKKLELSMSPPQITEARKLEAAFTPKRIFKKPGKK